MNTIPSWFWRACPLLQHHLRYVAPGLGEDQPKAKLLQPQAWGQGRPCVLEK